MKKSSQGKKMEPTQSQKRKTTKDDDDRLSNMPNPILLHIMSLMKIKDAVQTCILSKRWRDLWKSLPNLKLHSSDFKNSTLFSEFVSKIVSCRDGNHPLLNLDFYRNGAFQNKILTSLMKHAVSHKIQHLKIYVPYNIGLPPFLFTCKSLTSLHISVSSYDVKKKTKIPKSLKLPALVSLHLDNVGIVADDNGRAEPFSKCKKLNSLSLNQFVLVSSNSQRMSGILNITNTTLANLTVHDTYNSGCKFVISTPNLSSFTLNGSPFQTLRGQEGVNVELQSSSLI